MVNGFGKEWMFFSRGGRFIGLVIALFAVALSNPLMFYMLKAMFASMPDIGEAGGESFAAVTEMMNAISAPLMTTMSVEYVSGIGSIVSLFIFFGSAGGEQQKRSVIIPQCSGLTPAMYVMPKFIVYPAVMFTVSFLSVLAAGGASVMLFGGSLSFDMLCLSALCTALYNAFITVVQFTVGLCTGGPRLAVVSVILAEMIIPSLLSLFGVSKFNPFTLATIAESSAYKAGAASAEDASVFGLAGDAFTGYDTGFLNVSVSIGTAVVISVLLVFLTVFVLSAKQIKNEGSEPML